MTEIISCNSNIYWYIINVFHKISLRFHWDFSFLWFWPKVPYLTWFSVLTFLDQSSNSSWVFNFCLKLSPSAFSLCPSTWFSQPFPRTSSTRLMYADSWRSIWSRKLIDFYNYVLWLSRLLPNYIVKGKCSQTQLSILTRLYKQNVHWSSFSLIKII